MMLVSKAKVVLFCLLSVIASSAFAAPLEIYCNYPKFPDEGISLVESDQGEAIARYRHSGKELAPFRIKFQLSSTRNENSDTYEIPWLETSNSKLEATFPSSSLIGEGLLWKSLRLKPVNLECTRNRIEAKLF